MLPATRPDASTEPPVKLAAALILPAALGVALYAALALRGLFADGALSLFAIVETGSFAADWDPPRWTTHALQQFAAVLAVRSGVDDPEPLAVLLGLGMYVVPIGFLAGCYFLPPRSARSFFLLPLFHYLAGSQAAGFAGIAEAPMAAAYFWFLLFLILFRRSPMARAGTVLLAIPALWLHEAFALLGPLLTIAAMLRLRWDGSPASIDRVVLSAIALWFVAVTLYDLYVVYDRLPGARRSFLVATLAFGFVFEANLDEWVLRINVPALLGISAAVATGILWYREEVRGGQGVRTRATLLAFGLVSGALVAGTLWHGILFAPYAQFGARSWGAVMSLPLGVLCIGSLLHPSWKAVWDRRSTVALMGIHAAAQLGWHTIATGFWTRYVRDFRTVLASHEGAVPWPDAVSTLPPEERWALVRMSWGWTNPIMSFLLSPHGRVISVIDSSDHNADRRFTDPLHLPGGSRFDTTVYRAALLRQQSATKSQ
jgi:hypothetical protein